MGQTLTKNVGCQRSNLLGRFVTKRVSKILWSSSPHPCMTWDGNLSGGGGGGGGGGADLCSPESIFESHAILLGSLSGLRR